MAKSIDQLAREASRDAERVEVDLLKEDLRAYTAMWNILVWPRAPKQESAGGIALVKATQQAEEIMATIGQVIQCGPSALAGRSNSGIETKHISPSVNSNEQLIGKWVVYQRYAGYEVISKRYEVKLRVVTVSEILMVVDDPDEWEFQI